MNQNQPQLQSQSLFETTTTPPQNIVHLQGLICRSCLISFRILFYYLGFRAGNTKLDDQSWQNTQMNGYQTPQSWQSN